MRVLRQWIVTFFLSLAVLATGAGVIAQSNKQEKPNKPPRDVVIDRGELMITAPVEEHIVMGQGGGDTFMFVSSEMGFSGKVVKGAPYSAQVLTESVQTFGDGNRIVRKNTASVFRDGEGRTRREQTLKAIGPYAAAGDPPQTIMIDDPVSGTHYVLEPNTRTARKIEIFRRGPGPAPANEAQEGEALPRKKRRFDRRVESNVFVAGTPGPMMSEEHVFHYVGKEREAKTESLGKQVVEGVEAEGTRSTITIPAGEIGNELPIVIVSERWYSPDLQTVVMSKHSDPRFGETTYRLTNIDRSEPARSLFELPSGYTVKEAMPPGMQFKLEREINRPRQ